MTATTRPDDPLVPQLKELLCAAVRDWRKGARFGGAILTVVPDGLIDQVAVRLAPVLRSVTREAVRAELDAQDLATVATLTDSAPREAG